MPPTAAIARNRSGAGAPASVGLPSKDPYILAKSHNWNGDGYSLPYLSRQINELMPRRTGERILGIMNRLGKDLQQSKVFVLGIAFKGEPETNDMRSSPALDVIDAMRPEIPNIYGYDAVIPRDSVEARGIMWQGDRRRLRRRRCGAADEQSPFLRRASNQRFGEAHEAPRHIVRRVAHVQRGRDRKHSTWHVLRHAWLQYANSARARSSEPFSS